MGKKILGGLMKHKKRRKPQGIKKKKKKKKTRSSRTVQRTSCQTLYMRLIQYPVHLSPVKMFRNVK